MEQERRNYELAAIFDSEIEKAELDSHIAEVEKIVNGAGGTVSVTDNWGMRDFAYPIKKKRSGYYVFYYFDAPAETPHKIRDIIKLKEDVLRHMIVISKTPPPEKTTIGDIENEQEEV